VRSIDDCQRESLADISVATTLFEARLLAGPESLFAGMRRALAPDRLWSSQDFFEAKVKEQTERHHRYFDTAYNLEPNVKSSPGACATFKPSAGWQNAISAPTRSTSWWLTASSPVRNCAS